MTTTQLKNQVISGSNIDEKWLNKYWRPYMAFAYIAICLFDFVVGPFCWSIFQIIGKGTVSLQWVPLTLVGGGVFHVAMGAVLGISAFTRGQEKLQRLKTLEELAADDSQSVDVTITQK